MTIEQRVAKLEKQNRWMKRAGGLALAAVACVFLMGQGKEKGKAFEVGALIIKDTAGIVRAKLTKSADGAPALMFFGKAGNPRMVLNGAPALSLFDKASETRARLSVSADGTPSLTMHDAKGNVIWQAPPK